MNRVLSIFFSIQILFSICSAQTIPFGYKDLRNDHMISNAIFIQDGFVLDSATNSSDPNRGPFRFEYNDQGKLKRDINFFVIVINVVDTVQGRPFVVPKYEPGTRDYYYNANGKIDSVSYGYFTWDTNVWINWDHTDHYDYSSDGNLLSIIPKNYEGTIVGSTNYYAYDTIGNLISQQTIAYTGLDTTYNIRTYDTHNRLVLTKTFDTMGGTAPTETAYAYDSLGNIEWLRRNIGMNDTTILAKYDLIFDESDKLEYEYQFNGPWPPFKIDLVRDEFDRILSMDAGGSVKWFYNAEGNLDSLWNLHSVLTQDYFPGTRLVDSYGNQLSLPNYSGYNYFYYSPLSPTPPSVPTMRIPCTRLSFGDVAIDSAKPISFQITNTSTIPLVIDSIYTLTSHFTPAVGNAEVDQSLPYALTVQFKPNAFGRYSDTLFLKNNSAKNLIKIPVTGSSPEPLLKVTPPMLEFGQVRRDSICQKTVFLTDSSINTLKIDSIYTRTKYFGVVHYVANDVISRNDTAIITISFAPDSVGLFNDSLVIVSNSPGSPMRVLLTGNSVLTLVQNREKIPGSYALFQNYPNPFNPTTTIAFSLPTTSRVSLSIFDVLGRKVATIVNNEAYPAGNYSKRWDASGCTSGVYFYRLEAGTYRETRKLLLLK